MKKQILHQFLPLSGLENVTLINDEDLMEVVQAEPHNTFLSRKATIAQIKDYILDDINIIYKQQAQKAKEDGLKWVSQTYSVTQTDNVIRLEPKQDVYVLLPDATGYRGRVLIVKRVDHSRKGQAHYSSILVPQMGQAIDGAGYRCISPRGTVQLLSDGVNWETLNDA